VDSLAQDFEKQKLCLYL